MSPNPDAQAAAAADLIARWRDADGTELANYQLFVHDLATLLGVPHPAPAREDTRDNAYVFERRVTLARGDGTSSEGRIDCYRRGAFVLEAKRTRKDVHTKGFDEAMLRARAQAETYARALPAAEGRPPFLLVVDVGRAIELYAEFSRSGGTYTPFPDPRSHRIALTDLARPELRERLAAVWTDPQALDPARAAARATREIAARLAEVARQLESRHAPQTVASFLSRCLFTMFAEDVGLLPRRCFAELLADCRDRPEVLARQLESLWTAMDCGEFSPLLGTELLRFNGKLFKDRSALRLAPAQIDQLAAAARADWTQVEPAIFGTLLERALDPDERHALGAHYTPRAYVERLVLPTIIEPLREDWKHAQAAALVFLREHKADEARRVVREYLMRLCEVRVLDPACGSGNFLYVALEQMKRLEGEVLNFLDELGDTQGRLDLAGVSVDPHQLLGIELNPRAAAVAEMVLWIGYLQWHFRTRGSVMPPLPVLKDFQNIECRDAVLACDAVEFATDEAGRPLTRWDGKTTRLHAVTGLPVPDERAQVPVEKYVNPRAAAWPAADFVVGNPPFIGTKRMRAALGDGYTEALRQAVPSVGDGADFVMYWWDHAATLVQEGKLRRFGLITTNSLRQSFNRKVVERHLASKPPLSLVMAIPDHPWVDSADGAAVRIAMSVGSLADRDGTLDLVTAESSSSDGAIDVVMTRRHGRVNADLSIGADVSRALPLRANSGLSGMGVALHGAGFILDPAEAASIRPLGASVVRGYVGGRDLLQEWRERYLIDFSGLSEREAMSKNPAAFQRVIDRVKPERDHNNRDSIRQLWWRFGWERPLLRTALRGLPRYIGTTETAKHRVFQFIAGEVLADHMVVCFPVDSAVCLGVLASRQHAAWALATGGTLEDRPRYNKTRCFETFPFPAPTPAQAERIRALAEQIDAHRKRQQAAHPGLTLTGLYNVLEKLRCGEALNAKDKLAHEQGLVSVLRELHDELDAAVFAAYGWDDLAARLVGRPGATTPWPDKPPEQAAAEEELLARLVALNAQRAAEEARGTVRWLRPEFQAAAAPALQTTIDEATDEPPTPPAVPLPTGKRLPWPATLPEQIRVVAEAVSAAPAPLDLEQLAAHFSGRGPWKKRLPDIVDSLAALGRVKSETRDGRTVLHG